jgi:putative pyruvate formate lyase activating enzyme
LHCVFCQNHDISQQVVGRRVAAADLAALMLSLQARGCHNLNFVSPSHVAPQLLAALAVAYQAGLEVPTVYNCGGYEELATLRLLDGLIDVYMPDYKYGAPGPDQLYSDAPGYPEVARAALREMHRQVGDLELDERGLAVKGLLLRHLVLPGDLAASAAVARFVAEELSVDSYVNVMGQYRPEHRACEHEALSRRPTAAELQQARQAFVDAGLTRFAR